MSGKDNQPGVVMVASEQGGVVKTFGRGKGQAILGIDWQGDGYVSSWDKDGNQQ